jgi:hypothetical protein
VAALVDMQFEDAKVITADAAASNDAKPTEEVKKEAPAEAEPVDEKTEAAKS